MSALAPQSGVSRHPANGPKITRMTHSGHAAASGRAPRRHVPRQSLSGGRCTVTVADGILFQSVFSTFQNTGVAGPSSTPLISLRQTAGVVHCPSGM
jgi:hypothetical protein